MNASPARDATIGQAKRHPLPPWQKLFYLLAAFALLTVTLSLYLSHRFMGIYLRSVAVNQEWVEWLHECAQLGQLAVAVDAPGNDVFQSQQVEAEQARMEVALTQFNEHLNALREELGRRADEEQTAPLLVGLETVRQLMRNMAGEARNLFAHVQSYRTREAGESMASMDREFFKAGAALERVRGDIAAIQKRHFDQQTSAAGSLQRFQYVASSLILLMIVGSVAYGHRVRKEVEAATREKEGYIEALRTSEAQLDRRVRERTSELLEANELLRTEVEERRRAEEAVRQSEGRYRALIEVRQQLLKKLLSAQEDERRRIARDLHDEIGQALTSLLIGLRTVIEAPTLEAAGSRADTLRRIALSTLEEVRRLARGLRPSVLDDLGLVAALERYVADHSAAHKIDVEVSPDLATERLPEEVETTLYRIAQEALTNTARHAVASRVSVAVEREPAGVRLTVSDNGRGFRLPLQPDGGQLGLSGMQERAALLNGSLVVESEPGKGTTVTVHIPLAEAHHGNSRTGGG